MSEGQALGACGSAFIAAALLVAAPAASAQMTGAPAAGFTRDPGMVSSAVPLPLREIGFDQKLDKRLPLDIPFKDEANRLVRLGDYFGPKPIILLFVYYDCPMLCTQVLNALASTLGVLALDAGRDFDVVTISFDPREKPPVAAQKKALILERYRRPAASTGWHFLTGEQDSIDRVTKAAGFRFVWDHDTSQFAHPTGIIIVTPDGRPARYLFGIDYGPRDVRLALLEASAGKVGSAVDALLLYCYHYDPMNGRYGLIVMRLLRIAGAATVFTIIGFIAIMFRRERAGH